MTFKRNINGFDRMVLANAGSALKYSNLAELNERPHFGHFTLVIVKICQKICHKILSKNLSKIYQKSFKSLSKNLLKNQLKILSKKSGPANWIPA